MAGHSNDSKYCVPIVVRLAIFDGQDPTGKLAPILHPFDSTFRRAGPDTRASYSRAFEGPWLAKRRRVFQNKTTRARGFFIFTLEHTHTLIDTNELVPPCIGTSGRIPFRPASCNCQLRWVRQLRITARAPLSSSSFDTFQFKLKPDPSCELHVASARPDHLH